MLRKFFIRPEDQMFLMSAILIPIYKGCGAQPGFLHERAHCLQDMQREGVGGVGGGSESAAPCLHITHYIPSC